MRTPKEYQEALDSLSLRANKYNPCKRSCHDTFVIQELIDEATPTKVLNKKASGVYVSQYMGQCPRCGMLVQTIDKKPHQCICRQELDRSDE